VLNSDSVSIFAAPLTGSALANLVSKPLPIAFSVTANGATAVIPKVLAVNQTNAQMFGCELTRARNWRIKTITEHSINTGVDEWISRREYFYKVAARDKIERMESSNFNTYTASFNLITDAFTYEGDWVKFVLRTHHGKSRQDKWEYMDYRDQGFSVPFPSKLKMTSFSNDVEYQSIDYLYTFTKLADGVNLVITPGIGNGLFELHVGLDRNVYKMTSYLNNEVQSETVTSYDSHPNPPFYFRDLHWQEYLFPNLNANNIISSKTSAYSIGQLNFSNTFEYNSQSLPTKCTSVYSDGRKKIIYYEYEAF
jgi:hypothetical protein